MVQMLLLSAALSHIKLETPTEWLVTNSAGDPQKTGQCGSTTGTPSGVTTTVEAGSKLHVKWQETVLHPGHFRIAIATDRSQLADPVVTTQNGQCISAEVQTNPVAPVIADGLFEHTSAAPNNEYETDVTVPSTPCEHCTLQLVQFMGSHGAPCIYYHCADLRIVAKAAVADAGSPPPALDAGHGISIPVPDAGATPRAPDAGTLQPDGGTGPVTTGGCTTVDGSMISGAALVLALLRRRSPSPSP